MHALMKFDGDGVPVKAKVPVQPPKPNQESFVTKVCPL